MGKSCAYFSENGSEYTTSDGKAWWRCARCILLLYHILALGFLLSLQPMRHADSVPSIKGRWYRLLSSEAISKPH